MTPFLSAWHHIRRSPFQSLLALILVIFTFFTLTTYIILTNGLQKVLAYFETKPEITIYLKDGLEKTTVESLYTNLKNYTGIKDVRFISKEKALEIYKEQNKNNPLLTEMVTSSILPASFEVSVTDPSTLDTIFNDYSQKKDQIDEIIYQKDLITTLLNWTNTVRRSGLIFVIFTSSVSFLVIFVIITLKITQRKEEIKISRLLGASEFYVQRPFLIEGALYGLLGGAFGSLSSIIIFISLSRSINHYFQPVDFINLNLYTCLLIAIANILFAVFLGYLSSLVTSKRLIKF